MMMRCPAFAQRMVTTRLISATGQTSEAALAVLPRLRLGGVALNNIRAAFAPLHIFNLWALNDRPAMLVGIDVLRNFDAVTLDFGRREVAFLRGRPDGPLLGSGQWCLRGGTFSFARL